MFNKIREAYKRLKLRYNGPKLDELCKEHGVTVTLAGLVGFFFSGTIGVVGYIGAAVLAGIGFAMIDRSLR